MGAVSRELHRGQPARITVWADEHCDELKGGRFEAVLATLRAASVCEQARKCAAYMQRNRDRMRYAEYRAAGLCVGSGVVESGCE